jgi:hypothetical protein
MYDGEGTFPVYEMATMSLIALAHNFNKGVQSRRRIVIFLHLIVYS